tara:strand:- start:2324 stop:2662 length:339 start_codon:yes stop_codon:yes gene_type:complete
MSNSDFLHKVADVLEAVALEKEKLATELQDIKQEQRKDIIGPLVEKLSYLYQNDDENSLVSKLSSLDDETLSILSRATGTEAPQLGGSAKLASVSNHNNNHADSSFASWILS